VMMGQSWVAKSLCVWAKNVERKDEAEVFECVVELVPVLVTLSQDPLVGAAKLVSWLFRCKSRIPSYPGFGSRRRRRRALIAAYYDVGGVDWIVYTSGRISQ
jgi:hypothetical protein